jgi:hypothetical protein
MKQWLIAATLMISGTALQVQEQPLRDWIDRDTGQASLHLCQNTRDAHTVSAIKLEVQIQHVRL